MSLLESLTRQDLIIILGVSIVILLLLVTIIIILGVYCCRRQSRGRDQSSFDTKDYKGSDNGKSEDLPFRYRSPGGEIINRESCHYADWDYADYADGPIKYKQISALQAEDRRTPLNASINIS